MTGRAYKAGLTTVALLLLVVTSLLQRQLNQQRADLGLTRVAPLENAPPVLAFTTVALGGFRGLIANALWIRANDLQQEGKYFEQVQLSDWITKLEPTFVQVWLMQAWNMAYNISVKFYDPADRWRWVQRGIELLRDDGLRLNPGEALMYRELGWFFQHKMGQNMDDAHLFYKYSWANEITRVLGGPKPNYDELLNPRTDEARQRVAILREKYKMDPAVMKEADRLYGPLEWRLPEASAIYWAMVGLEKSSKKDLLTLRRVIFQSLHMCVMRGRIVLARPDGTYVFGPDLSKIPMANQGYETMIAAEKEKPEAIFGGYRNFLREAVFLLQLNNHRSEAERWMKVLKAKFPESVPANQTPEDYALQRLNLSITDINHNRTKAFIESFLRQHFQRLAVDDDDQEAAGFRNMAQRVWDYYDHAIRGRRDPLKMEPFAEFYQRILAESLDPQNGLDVSLIARLRTRLNLPVEPAPAPAKPAATNAPPKIVK